MGRLHRGEGLNALKIDASNSRGGVEVNLKYTMTSREVAELTGKRHDNVVRDIEKTFTDLKIEASDYLDSYQDSTGRTLKQYRLDRDLTMTLVTKYDTARRYAVVRRSDDLFSTITTDANSLRNSYGCSTA